jgi:RNA polymerase sigma-70 factor (ECF subfamily)
MDDDLELLDAWRAGDARAGERLFQRHFDALYRFFRNKVGAECEELMQRTLMICVEKRDQFVGKSSFRTWLFGIARFELLHFYRDRGKLEREVEIGSMSIHDLDPSPSKIVAGKQEERLFLEALRRLPMDLQIALELHYWERVTTAEMAEILEIPAGTVKSRLRRARERLEVLIGELATDPKVRQSTVMNLDGWAAGLRDGLER